MHYLNEAPWYSCYQQNEFDRAIEFWINHFLETADSYIPHYPTTMKLLREAQRDETLHQLLFIIPNSCPKFSIITKIH